MSRKPFVRPVSKTGWYFKHPRYLRYMSREVVESAHLNYCEDVSSTVAHLVKEQRAELGREPVVAALTHGQLTVPQIA